VLGPIPLWRPPVVAAGLAIIRFQIRNKGLAFDWVPYHIDGAFKTLHAGVAPGFGESLRES